MIYACGDDTHATRNDIPLPSQWIKNSFFGTSFLEGVTTRCGARNLFRFASSAENFDRCRIHSLASSATGGTSGRIRLEPPLR